MSKKKQIQIFSLLFILGMLGSSASYAKVEVFFNHNERNSYTEPYRKITRNGDNLEELLIKNINSAKKSIYLAVQELRLPLVAKALVQKSKEGVDVRVILENSYNNTILEYGNKAVGEDELDELQDTHETSSFKDLFSFVDTNQDGVLEENEILDRDAIAILRKNNIPIIDDTADGSAGSGLMHHKFMIIDSKKVIFGSANFTMSGVHGDWLDFKTRGNTNNLVSVPSVRMAKIFETEFFYMWGGKDGKSPKLFGVNKPYRGRQIVKLKDTTLTIQFSPTSRWVPWKDSVNGLIAEELSKTKKSVSMALFVFSEQKIADTLQEATIKKPSIDLKALVEPKFATRDYSELLDIWGIALKNEKCNYEKDNNPWKTPYMTAGIASRENGDVFHHKFAVVDGKTIITGSQNWSDSANSINQETLVVLQNKEIASEFETEFERAYHISSIGIPNSLLKKIDQVDQACARL